MRASLGEGVVGRNRAWLRYAPILGIAAVLAAGFFVIRWFIADAENAMRSDLSQQARLAARTLSAKNLSALSGTAADEGHSAFIEMKEQLATIRSVIPGCRFVYLVGRSPTGEVFFFVDNEPAGSEDYSPPGQVYEEADDQFHAAFDHKSATTIGPVTDRWGTWVTALAPVETGAVPIPSGDHRADGQSSDRNGAVRAVLGVDHDASAWTRQVLALAAPSISLVVVLVIAGVMAFVSLWRARGTSTPRVRRLLIPVALVFTLLLLGSSWMLYRQYTHSVDEGIQAHLDYAFQEFAVDIAGQEQVLETAAMAIADDPRTRQAMVDRAGAPLRALWSGLFDQLRSGADDDYLQFVDTRGSPILRLDRLGAGRAAQSPVAGTDPSKAGDGVQVDGSGMLVLKATRPVRKGDEVVGYVEIAREVDELIAHRNAHTSIRMGVIVDKRFVDRAAWERHNWTAGDSASWDRYANVVAYYAHDAAVADLLGPIASVADLETDHSHCAMEVADSATQWRMSASPLQGASGEELGHVLAAVDATEDLGDLESARLLTTLFLGLIIAGFMAFIYTLLRRADHEIDAKQRELEASERQLGATLRSIGDGVVACDAGRRVTTLNRVAEELTGWDTFDAAGRSVEQVFSLVDPATGDMITAPVGEALATGFAVEMPETSILVSFEGVRTHIACSCAPIRDPSGEVVGAVLVFRDVTEDYLRREMLRHSEERMRSLLASMQDLVFVLDEELSIVAYHSSSNAELATPPEDFLGHRFDEVGLPEKAVQTIGVALERALRHGEAGGAEYSIALSGEARWYDMRATPFRSQDGDITGVTCVVRDITRRKGAEEALERQANELAAANVSLERLANRDGLTGMVNRRRFLELVGIAAQSTGPGEPCAVLFLDLDNFKFVNDSMGHDAGDLLLVQVSKRMESCAGPDDIVARLGGDEFALLLPSPAPVARAEEIAEGIVRAMREPFQLGEHTLTATCSVGVSSSDFGATVETLIQNADTAMYYAKRAGKSAWRSFEPYMLAEVQARIELEADLRAAWANGEFVLMFMPLVDLESGRTTEVEALLRWFSPKRGWVPVDEFIPLAEEINLIGPLGEWVLESACAKAREWQQAWPNAEGLRVAVNVSAKQIQRASFLGEVTQVLDRTGLSPDSLILEVTETMVMTDLARNVDKLAALRDLGVKIAIDDFGTGYSSMGQLANLPVDTVKVDRSFVALLGDSVEAAAIVRALMTLCIVLGLDVVAEGIENKDQLVQVQGLGCHRAQGFLFAPPLTEHDLQRWLECGERPAAA